MSFLSFLFELEAEFGSSFLGRFGGLGLSSSESDGISMTSLLSSRDDIDWSGVKNVLIINRY